MGSMGDYFYKGPVIALDSGREITMMSLDQYRAYGHILEGIPYGQNYRALVDMHLQWAKMRYPDHNVIALLPRLREMPLPKEELERIRKRHGEFDESLYVNIDEDEVSLERVIHAMYKGLEPVSVGNVCCRAFFESEPVSDKTCSDLMVVWFQDGFAMPIDPLVLEQIRALDWEAEAKDFDY